MKNSRRTENPTRSSWIKLTDKMPDIHMDKCGNMVSEWVIIWREKDSEGGPFDWYDIGFLNTKCETFETFEYDQYPVVICSVRDVKAWMPLPEPYEEDENDEQ